jgi:hypothetical protein
VGKLSAKQYSVVKLHVLAIHLAIHLLAIFYVMELCKQIETF